MGDVGDEHVQMTTEQRRMNGIERAIARLYLTPFGIWFGYYVLPYLDRPLLRLSRGLISMSLGQPILLLTTIGARSGLTRTTPLLYVRYGNRIVILASNGGRTHHPAWYYNLRANPRVKVMLRGRTRIFRAHETSGTERDHFWNVAVRYFSGYEHYRETAGERQIPVIVLTPER